MAVDYAPFNIRCNSLHPGAIKTAMTKDMLADDAVAQAVLGPTIMKRWGEPRELAYPVLFLASSESSYMTGSEMVVDGGYTAA